jgi:hypothetical protein
MGIPEPGCDFCSGITISESGFSGSGNGFPGGNFGSNGFNAFRVVASDLAILKPWGVSAGSGENGAANTF